MYEINITPTEKKIISHVTKGLSNKEVASRLKTSESIVKFHLFNVYKKLNIKSRTQLITKLRNKIKIKCPECSKEFIPKII